MKNKVAVIYIFVGIFFISIIALMASNKNIKTNALGASVNIDSDSDKIALNAAKNMIIDNIDKYDGEVIIDTEELIKNGYIKEKNINKNNKKIVAVINNNKIEDLYFKNNFFKDLFPCDSICYINKNNYIGFNNDIYRIVKVDKEGYIYLTNNKSDSINTNEIDSYLKKKYNELDKMMVKDVISISLEDLKESNAFELEDNLLVKIGNDYKTYNYVTEKVEDNKEKTDVIPLIVLKNDISHEMGEGTKFNPYIIDK